MQHPLARLSLHPLRFRSSSRLFSICAIKRYSTVPPSTPPLPSPTAPPTSDKPYFITTPIFYVNAAPHVGHLYSTILTDIIKRWQQLTGRKALLSTGTDEHGIKVQQAAAIAEEDPETFCEKGSHTFKSLADAANCSYDSFIRTTNPAHHKAVQYFWQMLQSQDYIYQGKHEGWYSVSDETFYPELAIEHTLDPATGQKVTVSRETGKSVEWTSETNYHFRLSAITPKLLEFYKETPNFVVPSFRYTEVIAAVESGLDDLSISRSRKRLSWGIPVPNDNSQTIYVWLDALINYLTVAAYPWTPGVESAHGWPADLHVVGKDILKFHAIYWPAFLLALQLPPPKQVLAHAHWTMNHKKMSKSVGNVVNPFYAIQRYGVDTMRFFMAHDGGINDDRDYSNEQILLRYNHELRNMGNLLNRICSKTFDLDKACKESTQDIWALDTRDLVQMAQASTTTEEVRRLMEALDVPNALKIIMLLIHGSNKYMQSEAPWRLIAPGQKHDQNKIVFLAAENLRVAAILLQPFMPDKATEALDRLSVDKDKRTIDFATYGKDTTYGEGTRGKCGQLFPPLSEVDENGNIVSNATVSPLLKAVYDKTKEIQYHTKNVECLMKLQKWETPIPEGFKKKKTQTEEEGGETGNENAIIEDHRKRKHDGRVNYVGWEKAEEEEKVVSPLSVNRLLSPEIQKRDIEEAEWNAVKESVERKAKEEEEVVSPLSVNRLLSPEIQKRDIEEAEWNAVKESVERKAKELEDEFVDRVMGRANWGAGVDRRKRKLEAERKVVEAEKAAWRWL